MMSIVYIFWMYVILFAVIGAMRGWAKELLVAFSVITALAVNLLLEKYIPLVRDLPDNAVSLFWIRSIILIALVYFGYQTVASFHALHPRPHANVCRMRSSARCWAALMAISLQVPSYSIIMWQNIRIRMLSAPPTDPAIAQAIDSMMRYMPPRLLGEPGIYFAVIIILIFIIVVYI